MESSSEGFEFFLFRKNMGKYLRARREEEKGGSRTAPTLYSLRAWYAIETVVLVIFFRDHQKYRRGK